jgi:hypothetical protein
MSNVISLANYRRSSRKAYLAKNGARLNRFVERFVKQYVDVDFRQFTLDYQANQRQWADAAWDYVEFREVLAEALDAAFGSEIYRLLAAEPWFDRRMITQEEVIDRCITIFIMGRYATAHQT